MSSSLPALSPLASRYFDSYFQSTGKDSLKLSEAMRFLDISDATIRRWIKQKKLPEIVINAHYRFDLDTLARKKAGEDISDAVAAADAAAGRTPAKRRGRPSKAVTPAEIGL